MVLMDLSFVSLNERIDFSPIYIKTRILLSIEPDNNNTIRKT